VSLPHTILTVIISCLLVKDPKQHSLASTTLLPDENGKTTCEKTMALIYPGKHRQSDNKQWQCGTHKRIKSKPPHSFGKTQNTHTALCFIVFITFDFNQSEFGEKTKFRWIFNQDYKAFQ